uniref:I/LWEQ domain-containing protein n=1 Tax=Macrostomum lignano TaxID=282301 RepID=A0A1I8GE83_9PLAT
PLNSAFSLNCSLPCASSVFGVIFARQKILYTKLSSTIVDIGKVDMATSRNDDEKLGDDLESIGKTLNASATINKLASEMAGVKESLESTRKESEKIEFQGPYLRQLLRALGKSINCADNLCKFAVTMGEKHATCVKAFKEMAENKTITSEEIDMMETNFNKLLQLCEEFEKELNNFLESIGEARDLAEMASNEAKREEERLKREASELESQAKWNSAGLWAKRICTFGLITLSSDFQADVAANDARYQEAHRLKTLAGRFKKAHQDLNQVVGSIDRIKDRVEGGPIKLTKEMIDVIKHDVQLVERQNTIDQQKSELNEKDDEIARLKAQIAAAGIKN